MQNLNQAVSQLRVGSRVLKAWGLSSMAFLAMTVMAQAMPGVKVQIRDEGFYRVTKTELAAIWGVSEAQVASTSLKVSNVGREVASLRDGGDVIFYGHRYDGIYTDLNAYWIEEGQPVGMIQQGAGATATPYAPSFTFTKRLEEDTLCEPGVFKNAQTGYESPMFWHEFKFLSTWIPSDFRKTIVTDLANVVAGQGATVRIHLVAQTNSPNNRISLTVNGNAQGEKVFSQVGSSDAVWNLAPGVLVDGANTLVLEYPHRSATYPDYFLDFVDITHEKSFAAESNHLRFAGRSGSVAVFGLTTPSVRVWDVTDRWSPRALTGAVAPGQAGGWQALIQANEERAYAVAPIGGEAAPVSFGLGATTSLKDSSWALDHLIIAAPSLLAAAAPLRDYRAAQGLRAGIISVEQVYDDFNYGIRDAMAIRNFLSYARRNWSVAPRYVFLVGDGSLDYMNRLGNGDSLIPSVPVVYAAEGIYGSDFLYGDHGGSGDLDMAVGRLAVKTVQQVQAYIQKVMDYEQGGAWRNNVALSADKFDGVSYKNIAEGLAGSIVNKTKKKAYVDDLGIAATGSSILADINNGAEISVYVGHGDKTSIGKKLTLSSPPILKDSDIGGLVNQDKPTSFLLLGCLAGKFDNPGQNTFGDALMQSSGGAVSLIAAATFITANSGDALASRMLDATYSEGAPRLGDAWIEGKRNLATLGRMEAYRAFNFQGDPALAIGGDANAARSGGDGGPSIPSLAEWTDWHVSPALAGLGEQMDLGADPDGDGQSNEQEFAAGTDPYSRASSLRISDLDRFGNGQVWIEWPSAVQRQYRIESSDSITGPFVIVPGATGLGATPPFNSKTVSEAGASARFFRVVLD